MVAELELELGWAGYVILSRTGRRPGTSFRSFSSQKLSLLRDVCDVRIDTAHMPLETQLDKPS